MRVNNLQNLCGFQLNCLLFYFVDFIHVCHLLLYGSCLCLLPTFFHVQLCFKIFTVHSHAVGIIVKMFL